MNYSTYMPQPAAYAQAPAAYMPRPIMQPQPMAMPRPMYGAPAPTAAPVRVNGRAGADAYPMGPNETAVLFDENADVFYFKATDGAGYPTVRPFSFSPLPEAGAAPAAAYATVEDLEALRAEINELKGALCNGKQPVRGKAKPDPSDE